VAEPAPHRPIEDYALIGDGETAALVSRDGDIDWLCWPRFDSDACFAALLGDGSHGRWRLAPAEPFTSTRRYRPDTLVLDTRFVTPTGVVVVTDFMPARGAASHVVRLVRCEEGRVDMGMHLKVRFGYGRTVPWASRQRDGALRLIAGPDMATLRADVPTRGEDLATIARFAVSQGDTRVFTLGYQPSHEEPAAALNAVAALEETLAFWRGWIAQCHVSGPYAELVRRSLISLKAMIFAPTGGLVAAPTTSLPEDLGGERNWDYRYCWIRDATLSLLALMNTGFYREAADWRDWLLRAAAGNPADMQIMYGIGGERRLMEWSPGWLPGYGGSRPVRVGNAAHEQLQLDVYGELMDSLCQARRGGLETSEPAWALQKVLIAHLAEIWNEPDEGIWEVRGPRRRFTFSRVMAWVAVDRAIQDAVQFELEAPLDEWRALHATMEADVWRNGYDPVRNTFTQAYGEAGLDASLLLLAQVGFLPADHPAFAGTVAAIERELLESGFVRRYATALTDDGLAGSEGAFLACSFWLADAYVLLGRHDEARTLFERLLGICNDVGLLAEEFDPHRGCFAGNFPQAFSHVGLINTAMNLNHQTKPNDQRASRP
jgi:GH15 family glucan-1,4-alpha-glucosidase